MEFGARLRAVVEPRELDEERRRSAHELQDAGGRRHLELRESDPAAARDTFEELAVGGVLAVLEPCPRPPNLVDHLGDGRRLFDHRRDREHLRVRSQRLGKLRLCPAVEDRAHERSGVVGQARQERVPASLHEHGCGHVAGLGAADDRRGVELDRDTGRERVRGLDP